jgi:hypothetical protein
MDCVLAIMLFGALAVAFDCNAAIFDDRRRSRRPLMKRRSAGGGACRLGRS